MNKLSASLALTSVLVFGCCSSVFARITLAHPYSVGSEFDRWANGIAACIEDNFDIDTKVYPGGSLGRSKDIATGLASGVFDIGLVHVSAFEKVWPALSQLATLGLVFDKSQINEIQSSEKFINQWNSGKSGHKDLTLMSIGWRYATVFFADRARSNTIEPDDMAGLKIRSYGENGAFLSELGASPVRMGYREVSSALSYGQLDAAVIDVELAKDLIESGKSNDGSLFIDENFRPFASPYVAVLSNRSVSALAITKGGNIVDNCARQNEVFVNSMEGHAQALEETADNHGWSMVKFDNEAWSKELKNHLARNLDDRLIDSLDQWLEK